MTLSGKPRDAVRYDLQSAIAAAGAFAPQGWAGVQNTLLAIISTLFVLRLNSDETVSKGLARLAATAVGSAISVGRLLTLGFRSVWLSLAIVAGLMGAIIAYKPGWTYGFVAGVALVIGSDGPIWETAIDRAIAIAIGAVIGIAVSLIVWPESASTLVRRAIKPALDASCAKLSATITTAADSEGVEDRREDRRRYAKAISDACDASSSIKVSSDKKALRHRDLVDPTDRLWNALVILNRVSERQETEHLAVEAEASDSIQDLGDHAGDALAKLKELEPLSAYSRDPIEQSCGRARDAVTNEVGSERLGEEQVEQLALLFGIAEVSSNLRVVDDALKELQAA